MPETASSHRSTKEPVCSVLHTQPPGGVDANGFGLGQSTFLERLHWVLDDPRYDDPHWARTCDVPVASIAGWRRHGRISKGNLQALCTLTGVTYSWVVDGTGPILHDADDEAGSHHRRSQHQRPTPAGDTDHPLYTVSTDRQDVKVLLDAVIGGAETNQLTPRDIDALGAFVAELRRQRLPET